jgi:hypothetical protein
VGGRREGGQKRGGEREARREGERGRGRPKEGGWEREKPTTLGKWRPNVGLHFLSIVFDRGKLERGKGRETREGGRPGEGNRERVMEGEGGRPEGESDGRGQMRGLRGIKG